MRGRALNRLMHQSVGDVNMVTNTLLHVERRDGGRGALGRGERETDTRVITGTYAGRLIDNEISDDIGWPGRRYHRCQTVCQAQLTERVPLALCTCNANAFLTLNVKFCSVHLER